MELLLLVVVDGFLERLLHFFVGGARAPLLLLIFSVAVDVDN